jgi:Rieske Fe-S protein
MERRTVIASGGALAAVGVLAACGGSQTAQEVVGETPEQPEETSESGPIESAGQLTTNDVPVGGGVILEESKVVVVQPEAGAFAAFTAVCPHQGCLVTSVADNEIICACHDSRFSTADGSVIQGPALEGLTAAAISVDGDTITAG